MNQRNGVVRSRIDIATTRIISAWAVMTSSQIEKSDQTLATRGR